MSQFDSLSPRAISAMIRPMRALVLALFCLVACEVHAAPLQPRVDACDWHCTITLDADEVINDADPVLIRKDMLIVGPASAVVNSEVQVYGGATVEFKGFTFRQNKAGAPKQTGNPGPMFAQNGQVEVRSAQVYFTDVEMYCDDGATQSKAAIEIISGSVNFRAATKYTRIRYEKCHATTLNVYYGSYLALFGFSEDNVISLVTGSPNGVAVNVASSTIVANGAIFWNCTEVLPECVPAQVGINLARTSHLIFGSGQRTSVNQFSIPYNVVEGSSKWVGPTSSPQ